MSFPQFRALNTDDTPVEQINAYLDKLAQALNSLSILNGRLITGIKFPTTGSVAIPHGLGRIPLGYFCAGQSGGAGVYSEPSGITRTTSTLTLVSSVSGTTAQFWVW